MSKETKSNKLQVGTCFFLKVGIICQDVDVFLQNVQAFFQLKFVYQIGYRPVPRKPPYNRPPKPSPAVPPVCGRTPHVHQSRREAWPCDELFVQPPRQKKRV